MRTGLIFATLAVAVIATPVMAKTIYLDKLDKGLDDWWNALDSVCRGYNGSKEAGDLACDQRLQVDKIIKKRGCWNIYPATGPNDTSYWKCKK